MTHPTPRSIARGGVLMAALLSCGLAGCKKKAESPAGAPAAAAAAPAGPRALSAVAPAGFVPQNWSEFGRSIDLAAPPTWVRGEPRTSLAKMLFTIPGEAVTVMATVDDDPDEAAAADAPGPAEVVAKRLFRGSTVERVTPVRIDGRGAAHVVSYATIGGAKYKQSIYVIRTDNRAYALVASGPPDKIDKHQPAIEQAAGTLKVK